MKKIIEFLKENGIEYKIVSLGNPYYYNDGFTVQGITIRDVVSIFHGTRCLLLLILRS